MQAQHLIPRISCALQPDLIVKVLVPVRAVLLAVVLQDQFLGVINKVKPAN